jgi:hypothetical protein
MDLSQPPLPDLCHSHDWSPIAAAVGQAPIAAVLAGFCFSGATLILTVPGGDRGEAAASQALKLLFTAFFGLAVVAYLYSDLGGDQACPRAEIEGVLNGGILATFAVLMIVALTWLTAAYRPGELSVLGFLRGLIYVATAFVLLLLGTSSAGFINAELTDGSHLGVSSALFAVTAVTGVAGGVWVWRIEHRARGGAVRDPVPGTAEDAAVRDCVWAALAYLGVSALTSGVALSVAAKEYYPPPAWSAFVAAWASLVLPVVILALGIRAMARPTRPNEGNQLEASATSSASQGPSSHQESL